MVERTGDSKGSTDTGKKKRSGQTGELREEPRWQLKMMIRARKISRRRLGGGVSSFVGIVANVSFRRWGMVYSTA